MVHKALADRAAISISFLCLVHCLALPSLVAVVPWLVPGFVVEESFHTIAVLAALPVSAIALAGSLQARPLVVATAALGLALLFAGTRMHGELLEVSLSVSGALLVAFAHLRNLLQQRGHA